MFKNYFKIALRNFRKDKGFSAINIFGLALGLATCLLITLYVVDEFGYDRYNVKADRIYRLSADLHINDVIFVDNDSPFPMGPALASESPVIEKMVRFANGGDMLVKKDRETIMEHHSIFADSTFFEIFTVPMLSGDPKTALVAPNSMVISESMARKYFGSTDVLGNTLLTSNIINYKITGVIKDMPARSHFHFDFIKAMSELDYSRNSQWLGNNCFTYVLVRPGTDEKSLTKSVDAVIRKYIGPQLLQMVHINIDDLAKSGNYIRYPAMPLKDIHLHSHLPGEFEANGNIQYVGIFIVIAIFILLVACVNFMNLSTARSAGRAKEVGIRKMLGSERSGLIYQFLAESVLTSFFSLILAILIAWAILPFFNNLSGKKISLNLFSSYWLLPSLLLSVLLVGLLAGSYPAFYLSSFRPIQVLKGKIATGFKSGWLRSSLVVFQFATAILLIIGTLVIYSQLNYVRHKELGYDREQVVTLQNTYSLWIHADEFKKEVLTIPGVVSGTMTRYLPNGGPYDINGFFKTPVFDATQALTLGTWRVDADYLPTLGMKIVAGRNFSPQMLTDSSCVLINETAAKVLGYKDPLNKIIYHPGAKDSAVGLRIIGVVRDFHATSLHDKIPPIVLLLDEERGAMSFRLNSKNIPAVLAQIEQKYHGVEKMAGQPFLYSFMDDDFNRLYQADQRTGKIFITFASFAILIACLGLFGLVTYAAEQRTKEIGIRKVLGASVGNVVGLLSKDFLKLVLIAGLIAFPLAWWGMSKWLEEFAYRTQISWWVFLIAGSIAAFITLVTVSFRAIKSALANPVTSLRSE